MDKQLKQLLRFLFTASVMMGGGFAGGFTIGYLLHQAPSITILAGIFMIGFIVAAAQLIREAYIRADHWKRAQHERQPIYWRDFR